MSFLRLRRLLDQEYSDWLWIGPLTALGTGLLLYGTIVGGFIALFRQERRLANHIPTNAIIISSRELIRPAEGYKSVAHIPLVDYKYAVRDHWLRSSRLAPLGDNDFSDSDFVTDHPPGSVATVYYDPANPQDVFFITTVSSGPYVWIILLLWTLHAVAYVGILPKPRCAYARTHLAREGAWWLCFGAAGALLAWHRWKLDGARTDALALFFLQIVLGGFIAGIAHISSRERL